ncbi:energy-coupling factor transporter transmembrane component T [Bacillus sp. JCM 19041]|uniref:energy-coupling factor transporter transmembrane component T family protein n=1 Tax=Bacillus sp. JCM 19041 TaxID=1460637 RepID=UPI00336AD96E
MLFLLLYCAPFLLLFVSSSSAMMLFGKGDTTWFQYGIIHITEESFYRGIHLGMRATVFAVLGLLFALTTKPVRLFYSLMQQLKFPTNLAYSFMASIRMLPIMVSEFQTLLYAYEIRGLNQRKGVTSFYKKLIFFSIPLLAQAIRRAQRIAVAMEAKQFKTSGRRSHFYQIGFGKNDLYYVSVIGLLLLSSSWIGQLGWFIPVLDVRYFEASM